MWVLNLHRAGPAYLDWVVAGLTSLWSAVAAAGLLGMLEQAAAA